MYVIDKDKDLSQMFKSNLRMLRVANRSKAGVAKSRRCMLP